MPGPSANRLRSLLIAFAASLTSEWVIALALPVFVWTTSDSVGLTAAVAALRVAPMVFARQTQVALALPAGRLLVAGEAARAAVAALLAAAAAANSPSGIMLVGAFAAGVAGMLHRRTADALVPVVTREAELASASALKGSVETATYAAGPLVAALALWAGTPAVALGVAAAGFALAAGAAWPLRETRAGSRAEGLPEGDARPSLASPATAVPVAVLAVTAAVFAAELLVLLFISPGLGVGGVTGYPVMVAALGIGAMVFAGAGRRASATRRSTLLLAAALVVWAGGLAGLAFVSSSGVALVLLVIQGLGVVAVASTAATLIQRSVRGAAAVQVFETVDILSAGATVAGFALVPALTTAAGSDAPVVLAGALAGAALLALVTLARQDAAARTVVHDLEPRIALLRTLGIFEGASDTTLESIAATLEERDAQVGDVLVEEGGIPKDFFVVVSGELEVVSSREGGGPATRVNLLHAGDYFGEIGLLEGMPRTATVRAVSECSLYRVRGGDFLGVLNLSASVPGSLLHSMRGRLARTHPSYRPAAPD